MDCFFWLSFRGVFTKPIDSSSQPQQHFPKANGAPKRCVHGVLASLSVRSCEGLDQAHGRESTLPVAEEIRGGSSVLV